MISAWTKHIKDPEEKANFEKSIYNAISVLDRLKQIIAEEEQALNRSELDPSVYDKPNWEYRQAHKNGIRQALDRIKKFIDLDQV